MEIGKGFSLKKDGDGVLLIEQYEGKNKDGDPKMQERRYSYGCTYQALNGFLKYSIGKGPDLDALREEVADIRNSILELEGEIKNKFRIEVRVSDGKSGKKAGGK